MSEHVLGRLRRVLLGFAGACVVVSLVLLLSSCRVFADTGEPIEPVPVPHAVAILLSLALGKWLKNRESAAVKFSMVWSFLVSLVVHVAALMNVEPAQAHAAPVLGVLAAFGWKSVLLVVARALADAIFATGAHSGPKNIAEGIRAKRA